MSEHPDELPLDSDVEVEESPGGLRPAHLQARFLLLVAAGGAVGTAVREGLTLLRPPVDGVAYTTVAINLVGAFVLGALLETLLRRGEDHGHRRAIRLGVGTGVLGGFTTYSALATDTALLLHDAPLRGVGYALATLLLGAVATVAGIVLASLVPEGER